MSGKLYSEAQRAAFGVDSYYDRGTTTTRANSTLFVAFRDATVKTKADERAAKIERLFAESPGYIGVRQVRAMCFVDFEDIKSATAAMMKHQGHEGLTIDYDKDKGVAGKRRREREETTERNLQEGSSASYYCAVCGTKANTRVGAYNKAIITHDEIPGQQQHCLLLSTSIDTLPQMPRLVRVGVGAKTFRCLAGEATPPRVAGWGA